jgi:long-chain acyl-CoA synthetase
VVTDLANATLGERISYILTLEPGAVAIQFGDVKITWDELRRAAVAIERLLVDAGIEPSAPIGWAARNRPAAVAAFVALVANGRMVVPLRPAYALANFRDDIVAQRLKGVIGDPDDWSGEGVIAAAHDAGTFGMVVKGPPFQVEVIPELAKVGPGSHRAAAPGFVLERLTSGTTGVPKRVPVKQDVLVPSLRSGELSGRASDAELRVKRSPALLFKPFSHAGGLFALMLALYQARPMVLFEKFKVDEWVAAVKTYKPKSISVVPTMIRMLLDADLDPQDLSSLLAIRCGTAPLETAVQEEFERRYGVPILIDYGAAEFIGGIAGWTLEDYRKYGPAKRGSVGRPRSDVKLRTIDPDSLAPQAAGEVGLLEIKSDRYGADWIRTNDLALLDAEGFVFLRGRADDAINRGGFKILPDEVAAVLRRYPGIADAAVIGAPDLRLGQVPIAALEVLPGDAAPDPAAIEAYLRQHLPAYMIPVEYRVVAALPRTASLKVSRPDLRALLGL